MGKWGCGSGGVEVVVGVVGEEEEVKWLIS